MCAVLAGCRASTPEPTLPIEPQEATPAAPEPEPAPEPAPAPTVVSEPTPVEAAEGDRCETMLAHAFQVDADGATRIVSGFEEDEVRGCCRAAKDELDAARQLGGLTRDCCSLLPDSMSGACTPWGPPAPPATAVERPSQRAASRLRVVAQAALGVERPTDARTLVTAVETWRGRMVNETVSSRVFEQLAAQMDDAGFDADTVAQWRGFADEERRHGRLCASVVVALGAEPARDVPALPDVPEHAHLSARARVLCNVLSVSALSETVAVALIEAERLAMPEGPLRTLLTEILADEVGHARAGWRLLARELQRDPSLARALVDYAPIALDALVEHELAHLPEDGDVPPDGARYGLCAGDEARALLFDTIAQVIRPGLDQLLAA